MIPAQVDDQPVVDVGAYVAVVEGVAVDLAMPGPLFRYGNPDLRLRISSARAKHIAWVGAGFAASICLVIGLTVALFPTAWVGLFSSDAAVLDSGARYLRTVAPFYALLAAGIALYFASQGAGSVLPPMLAGTVRLALVVAGGLAAVSLQGLFTIIAAAMIAYGALTIWFVAAAKWK